MRAFSPNLAFPIYVIYIYLIYKDNNIFFSGKTINIQLKNVIAAKKFSLNHPIQTVLHSKTSFKLFYPLNHSCKKSDSSSARSEKIQHSSDKFDTTEQIRSLVKQITYPLKFWTNHIPLDIIQRLHVCLMDVMVHNDPLFLAVIFIRWTTISTWPYVLSSGIDH